MTSYYPTIKLFSLNGNKQIDSFSDVKIKTNEGFFNIFKVQHITTNGNIANKCVAFINFNVFACSP